MSIEILSVPSDDEHKQDAANPANEKPHSQDSYPTAEEIAKFIGSAIERELPSGGSNDPFAPENLSKMRLSQDFASMAAVKPAFTTISVRRPHKQEFVRVREGAEWRFETGCFIDKETREVYLVAPSLWPTMPSDVTPTALVLAMSRNSPVPFLWQLTLPSTDGRPNRWHESGIHAARLAESNWLKCVADMGAGCYVPLIAGAKLPEPVWPTDYKMEDFIRLAFQGRFINDVSHPCLKRLRGEI